MVPNFHVVHDFMQYIWILWNSRATGIGDPEAIEGFNLPIDVLRAAIDKPFGTPLLHTVPTMGYRLIAPDTA